MCTSITNNEKYPEFSIMDTILWLILITIGVQISVGIIIKIIIQVLGLEFKDLDLVFLRPDIILLGMAMTVIISIPLIKRAAHSTDKTLPFNFLAIKPINKVILIKILVMGSLYYCLMSIFMQLLNIDTPQYMLDAKSQVTSTLELVMLITAVCIIAPVFEEIVFRGLAFSRLQNSKLGPIGAIIITSIIFTGIHIQYEFVILVFLFPMALLYGLVRYKTENVTYCIALHILCNSLSTFQLFFLHS
jgi:membrane protease YdiL (CAAX protease family)